MGWCKLAQSHHWSDYLRIFSSRIYKVRVMSFVGSFSNILPGETDTFSFTLTPRLNTGETIASATASIELSPNSNVVDLNASSLIKSGPYISGNVVSVQCGGSFPGGFQPGALYQLWITSTTSTGRILETSANIPCLGIT
jgi:hypothetical protein